MSAILATVEYDDGTNTITLERRIDTAALDKLTDDQRAILDNAIDQALDEIGGYRDDAAHTLAALLMIDEHATATYAAACERRGVLAL